MAQSATSNMAGASRRGATGIRPSSASPVHQLRTDTGPLDVNSKFDLARRKKAHPAERLSITEQLKLAAQPRMEIVAMPQNGQAIRVNKDCEPESAQVNVKLQRGTRLRVLETRKLQTLGLARARVVLDAEMVPLGWMTIGSKDSPILRPMYARPFYEVVSSCIVRKDYPKSSRAVCMLPLGTKLNVVETRRTTDGDQRVLIVLLGQDEPIGWITAKRPQTDWVSIREAADDLFTHGPTPPASRPSSSRGRSQSPRDFERWVGSSAREQSHATAAQAIAQARTKKHGSPHASPKASPRSNPFMSPSSPGSSIFNAEVVPGDCSTGGFAAAPSNTAGVEAVAAAQAISAGVDITDAAAAAPSSSAGVDEARGGAEMNLDTPERRETTDAVDAPIVQSSVLQADIKRYEQIILDEEAKLDPSKKSMSVLIGESLVASNIKIHDLIVTWIKRVDQPVSKIEFRQHIGKLVDGADTKQIDALFESLDEDNSGTLSLVEIRSAMAKFQGDASAMVKTNVLIKAKIERTRKLEQNARQALEATYAMEVAARECERLTSNQSLRARLGAHIMLKRMNVDDELQNWGADSDGLIDKAAFRSNIKALGMEAEDAEIDEVFDSFNAKGVSKLTVVHITAALKALADDAAANERDLKELKRELVELDKAAQAGQISFKSQQREDARKESAAAKRDAGKKGAASAETKASRAAAIAEKKAAAAAAKVAFDAKVEAIRKSAKRGYYSIQRCAA